MMVSPTKEHVAVVLNLYKKSSQGYFPELTELLQGIKSVRDKIKGKKPRISFENFTVCVSWAPLHKNLSFMY